MTDRRPKRKEKKYPLPKIQEAVNAGQTLETGQERKRLNSARAKLKNVLELMTKSHEARDKTARLIDANLWSALNLFFGQREHEAPQLVSSEFEAENFIRDRFPEVRIWYDPMHGWAGGTAYVATKRGTFSASGETRAGALVLAFVRFCLEGIEEKIREREARRERGREARRQFRVNKQIEESAKSNPIEVDQEDLDAILGPEEDPDEGDDEDRDEEGGEDNT